MGNDGTLNRRRALGVATIGALAAPHLSQAETLRRTPVQVLGPFYPVAERFPRTHDLTRPPSGRGRAQGELLRVSGRVLNRAGRPVPQARMEIWQANRFGRYAHPSDSSDLPLDPNFRGLATFETDAQGRYAFLTVRPGGYPSDRGLRAPHLHCQVTGRTDRLVTQIYFPDDPRNAEDPFLRYEPRAASLMLVLTPASTAGGPTEAVFDVVINTG